MELFFWEDKMINFTSRTENYILGDKNEIKIESLHPTVNSFDIAAVFVRFAEYSYFVVFVRLVLMPIASYLPFHFICFSFSRHVI